jgi:hypothetical protein
VAEIIDDNGQWCMLEEAAPIVLAGQLRLGQGRDSYLSSQLDLLGNAERVIDLYTEVADRAFELRVPEE